jgi:cytochrome c
LSLIAACNSKPVKQQHNSNPPFKIIPGNEDPIPRDSAQKGKVLIAYADCYTCHKEQQKSVGPSFEDIAKRYPANKVYIQMLAQKIKVGGSGNWGTPVMSPHPDLSLYEAKLMVNYVLSLDQKMN